MSPQLAAEESFFVYVYLRKEAEGVTVGLRKADKTLLKKTRTRNNTSSQYIIIIVHVLPTLEIAWHTSLLPHILSHIHTHALSSRMRTRTHIKKHQRGAFLCTYIYESVFVIYHVRQKYKIKKHPMRCFFMNTHTVSSRMHHHASAHTRAHDFTHTHTRIMMTHAWSLRTHTCVMIMRVCICVRVCVCVITCVCMCANTCVYVW